MHPTSPTAGERRIRPVPRFRVSDSAAAQLEQLIRAGVYSGGDKLPPERELSEELAVGRSSMREALRVLEARGLVTIVHGVGVFVEEAHSEIDGLAHFLVLEECTIPELFEVRRALECAAAALAAKRIAQSDAVRLKATLVACNDPGLSDAGFIEKDAELHLAIMLATRNNLLIRIYESTRRLFVEYSVRVMQLPGRRASAKREHAAIVDAIVSKRPAAAQAAMRAHLEAVEHDIVAYLDAGALRPKRRRAANGTTSRRTEATPDPKEGNDGRVD